MPKNIDWIVKIRIAYIDLCFKFDCASDAEEFATIAAKKYMPQKEKCLISIFASILEDVAAAESENENEGE